MTFLADPADPTDPADLERRFSGLRRLHGDAAYGRLRAARAAVVGVGGVGSWAAEALARCGIARLVLIDLDHVAESNIQRQVQAVSSTVGQAKVHALAERLAQVHPGCELMPVEAFVEPEHWPDLLPAPVDVVIDACDQTSAKLAMLLAAPALGARHVVCGAAGGKSLPHRVRLGDLAEATHDPLLAALRQRWRKAGAPRQGKLGVACVYSEEPVARPMGEGCSTDGSLNCHGYGSTVTVTASFGMVAAHAAMAEWMATRG